MAISAVDLALWDLHARILQAPLCVVLGRAHDRVPVYGSGGFTSYSDERLQEQLAGWVEQGIPRVKMKIGADPAAGPRARPRSPARRSGPRWSCSSTPTAPMTRKQALALAERFREESDVSWFEEPVSSDDLLGLRLLRDHGPAGMRIAAGEYGYDAAYFERMLAAGAVDVLQADVTRCGGVTGLLGVGALCDARNLPFSCHCGPTIHVHAAAAIENLIDTVFSRPHPNRANAVRRRRSPDQRCGPTSVAPAWTINQVRRRATVRSLTRCRSEHAMFSREFSSAASQARCASCSS